MCLRLNRLTKYARPLASGSTEYRPWSCVSLPNNRAIKPVPHYSIFNKHDNFSKLIPDMDKKRIVPYMISKVFYYFVLLTDQKTAYDLIFKEITKTLESIKPIE